ncbi:MAG: DUF393 domain-containing protein [Arcobacter butzleri]|jgi:predicted DCC family thiol-disulfide oxidoreductase YuxK|nr:DUF393 domain-containing protein [Arcobacteraceae bacterium]MDY0365760.1 DCC1-like thiol-disulfide oxidoreductase family protein [Arcobacteraceae bacterium]NLO16841.1 DUF393 domain-containing protein [Aliarcobacter butzleri]
MDIVVFYDKECPFCDAYHDYIKLKSTYDLKLLNAREELQEITKLKAKGFDINDGVIVIIDSRIYQGSQAIFEINKLLKKENLKDKIGSKLIQTKLFSVVMYPLIKKLRNVVLFILRKDKEIL